VLIGNKYYIQENGINGKQISLGFSKMSYKNDLIEKYISMVFEYLSIMQSSDVIGSITNPSYAIQLGLSAITHIFKLAFINTKNMSTTETYYQKGIYCYVEYLEQFNKLSATQPLDYADAVGFIYDRTLSDLHANGSSSVFTNILSVSQSHQAQGDDFSECIEILNQVGTVASSLLWLTNKQMTLMDQIEIVEQHFVDFICASSVPEIMEPIFTFLDTIQTHILDISGRDYDDILLSIKKRLTNKILNTKPQQETQQCVVDSCLILVANYSGKSLKYIAEQEGWRKPGEDLVKAIWTSLF